VKTLEGRDQIAAAVGPELGVSKWMVISQEQIDGFAAVAGDHYWIHTDPVLAAATTLDRPLPTGFSRSPSAQALRTRSSPSPGSLRR
jgi:acyl dehydratase